MALYSFGRSCTEYRRRPPFFGERQFLQTGYNEMTPESVTFYKSASGAVSKLLICFFLLLQRVWKQKIFIS
jgi:hypothetical protein